MKIVVLEGNAVNPGDLSWAFLRRFGDVTVYPWTANEEAAGRIGDAEILLVNKVPVNEALLEKCPNIRLICVLATGYNVIDLEATRRRNITVCNVPDYGTAAVAQFTFALLLELCHRVGHHDDLVHQGRWGQIGEFCFWDTPQTELAGKTLGIIGFGRIGKAVARIAKAFGMQVLAYSRSENEEGRALAQYVGLRELLAKSDVVSLHCPLTKSSLHLINEETIHLMKDGALLLNTARGAVIHDASVAKALHSGKLGGAAVDVVTTEPIEDGSPLLTAPNCIITPHMAWAPKESRQRILDCTERSIEGFLKGMPVNTV